MRDNVERVSRFVDQLLRERRPPRFPADAAEAPDLFAASALKAARPGADLPSPGFIRGLESRLAAEVIHPGNRGSRRGFTRRTVLQVSGASAAALAVGVAVGRVVSQDAPPPPDSLATAAGRWVAVVSTGHLEPGRAVRFSTPGVEGFVVNHDGAILAMSAVCTHMGCILHFNQPAARLDCPCHGASFALDGSPISREYLRSLPRLPSRVREGSVEVEVPLQA